MRLSPFALTALLASSAPTTTTAGFAFTTGTTAATCSATTAVGRHWRNGNANAHQYQQRTMCRSTFSSRSTSALTSASSTAAALNLNSALSSQQSARHSTPRRHASKLSPALALSSSSSSTSPFSKLASSSSRKHKLRRSSALLSSTSPTDTSQNEMLMQSNNNSSSSAGGSVGSLGRSPGGSSGEEGTAAANGFPQHMPVLGDDGIYQVSNPEEHAALMEYAQHSLVILKVYAPWCRACKGLEPKFRACLQEHAHLKNILWASLSIQHNKAFVQKIGVLALPTIQFYVGGQLVDTFPCGPSKVSKVLIPKLAALVADHVDTNTGMLRPESVASAARAAEEAAIQVKAEARAEKTAETKPHVAPEFTEEQRAIFNTIPYFQSLALADLDVVLQNAVPLQFKPGSILVREGKPGRTFYVIDTGHVEICQATSKLSEASYHLGSVVNTLGPGDWFGERALITGEPRAASIRVARDGPVSLFSFDASVFPDSCVLSGKSKNTFAVQMDKVNDKYGLDLTDTQQRIAMKQMKDSSVSSQVRGSANSPQSSDAVVDEDGLVQAVANDDAIFSLLTRFSMIRHVSTCFSYIKRQNIVWGDAGSRTRRNMLADKLSAAQRQEFTETFAWMDVNGDGVIELAELRRLVESVENQNGDNTEDEFVNSVYQNGVPEMTFEDYIGIMAEAEFYHLFRDIFASLDTKKSGYVKARELDRVLSGVRDLISDDRKSVIDVDDKDMLIDYEQFSRMLLGTALI